MPRLSPPALFAGVFGGSCRASGADGRVSAERVVGGRIFFSEGALRCIGRDRRRSGRTCGGFCLSLPDVPWGTDFRCVRFDKKGASGDGTPRTGVRDEGDAAEERSCGGLPVRRGGKRKRHRTACAVGRFAWRMRRCRYKIKGYGTAGKRCPAGPERGRRGRKERPVPENKKEGASRLPPPAGLSSLNY